MAKATRGAGGGWRVAGGGWLKLCVVRIRGGAHRRPSSAATALSPRAAWLGARVRVKGARGWY